MEFELLYKKLSILKIRVLVIKKSLNMKVFLMIINKFSMISKMICFLKEVEYMQIIRFF